VSSQPGNIVCSTPLDQILAALLPLLLGLELMFWLVFLPIGLRGDADFSIFYTAGTMLRTGHSHQLYDYDLELQIERALVSKTPAPYNHLPYEALPFVPLSKLPYRSAYIVFLFCNLAFAIVGLRLLKPGSWTTMAALAAYFPLYATIADGQDSVMLLVIAIASWSLFSRGRESLAGAVLALGLFRFTIVLPVVGLILLWKRWRFVAAFAVFSLAMLGLSFWIVGVPQMRLYVTHLMSLSAFAPQEAGYYSLTYSLPRMMNLRGFFVNVLPPHVAEAVTLIASLALFSWVTRRGRMMACEHQFALAVACSVLVSYHLFVYDLAILLIPMMAIMELIRVRQSWVAYSAVLIPLLVVPLGYLWRPYLTVLPLLAFLLIVSNKFGRRSEHGASEPALQCLASTGAG
jgi:Glycosyltransferase family 87